MFFKKDELKHLGVFYVYLFLYGLSTMILPFLIIYFRELNFTFLQIGFIMGVMRISMVIFEIPTGAFADSFSRKKSVIFGFIFGGTCIILVPFVNSYLLILVLWSLIGLAFTFVSGAEDAWVISNLNFHKRKDLHHEYFTKARIISTLGIAIAPFIGSLLVKFYSIKLLWIIFGTSFFVNALILFMFAKEHYKSKKLKIIDSIKKTKSNTKKAVKFALKNRQVFLLLLGSMFVALMFFGVEGWQPLLVSLSLPKYALGIVETCMQVTVIIALLLSGFLVKKKLKYVLPLSFITIILISLSLLFVNTPYFIFGAMIYALSNGIFFLNEPLIQSNLHKYIPEKLRATVTSTRSMLLQLVGAIGAVTAGYLMDIFGPKKVIAYGSLFGIFAIITFLKLKDDKK